MGTPYLGEIRVVSFNFAPKGWALCNGQVLSISQYNALFALLGTTYGGDGIRTFALPNLQSSVPVHQSPSYPIGQTAGEISHTLNYQEMAYHIHLAQGVSSNASTSEAAGATWAVAGVNNFSDAAPNTNLNSATLTAYGNGQPHDNMPPYLVLNFVIAMSGIFPSRD